ncbi:MAG: amidohydrolase [Erysipelotrichaceae bacterium]|nr:amidohydrolase [Erysipelotrichaceae bacterium]MDY5252543.1 amidohydrolase [Erysipelotrichaceae bacterium]
MRKLITNGWILTMDEHDHEYRQGDILIEDDKIVYVGSKKTHEQVDEIIDGQDCLIIPGMVNTHCHVPMMPFRSLGDDCPDRLRRFLFPLENACMKAELAYAAAKYGMAEMLLSGITTFADMYYFMDELATAAKKMGIRALLGETVIDQPTCDASNDQEGLRIGEQFIQKWQGDCLVKPILALHATNTNKAETFQKAMAIVNRYDTLLMSHVAEMDYEMKYFAETYQMTPIEWLNSINCLNDRLLAVHCIHVSNNDIELMKEHDVKVAHCPASNLKAGKGIAPVKDMIDQNIAVGFGTDGASSGNTLDLFIQMRMFAGAQKTKYHDRSLFPAKEIVKIATIGGAKTLMMDKEIGTLEVGKKADIVMISLAGVHMFPQHDPYSLLVYSANAQDVKHVFVNGQQVVKDRNLAVSLAALRQELADNMEIFNQEAAILSQKIL